MQSILILAHAEEVHAGTGESIIHLFDSGAFALAAWLMISAAVVLLTRYALRFALPKTLLALAVLNLFYGGFLYNKSPGVGALAVSAGFALTLAIVIVGLQVPSEVNQEKG